MQLCLGVTIRLQIQVLSYSCSSASILLPAKPRPKYTLPTIVQNVVGFLKLSIKFSDPQSTISGPMTRVKNGSITITKKLNGFDKFEFLPEMIDSIEK